MKQVAVTGLGAVSPLGNDPQVMWKNLLEGKSGVQKLSRFDASNIGVKISAQVKNFNVAPYLKSTKQLKTMSLSVKYLIAATHMALKNAGLLEVKSRHHMKSGVIIGTGLSFPEYPNFTLDKRPPLWYLETFPNLAVSHLSINFELKGYFNTLVNACASGTQAIADAVFQIQTGRIDFAISGATDSKITEEHLSGFKRLGCLSNSNNPKTALKPFDQERDGCVIGEGAGVLVLESYEHALKRGAPVYGLIVGCGSAMDSFRLTDPHVNGEGLFQAMKAALQHANIHHDDLNYINAHGTSTQANDRSESIAIKRLLGDKSKKIPVSSSKSMLGHTTAASGALEAIICLCSLQDQAIHLTKNFKKGCEICDLDYVAGQSRNIELEYVMSNSAGFGGLNSSIILKRV